MNHDLNSALAGVVSESTEGTRRRNNAKNLAGIMACTGLSLGVDWFSNNRFDNLLLDVAAGGGLYDGLSSGFGRGVLGLMVAVSPETLEFVKQALYYNTDVFREFL